jgi:DNA polymerase-3 subunit epsilon
MKEIIRCTGVDLETTGIKFEDGHKIVEFAFTIYDYHTATKTFTHKKSFCSLVNPKRAIPEESQNIHHITPEMVASKKDFDHYAPIIAKVLASTDVLIAHNMGFDGPFLHYEMSKTSSTFNLDCEPFCTMLNGRFATAIGKVPTLEELCWSLDVDFDADAAHRADYDTDNMMLAFVKGVEEGIFVPDMFKTVNT